MKRVLLISLAMVAVFMLGSLALAHTSREVTESCPLCKHSFTYTADMSGYQSGMRLDLKPVGAIAAPWRIPVCPKCGLVFYKNVFSEKELPKCRTIIKSSTYKKRLLRGSYVLLGLLYEGLGRDELSVAHVFLKASWQEEDNEQNRKEDLERSLSHFDAYLNTEKSRDEEWQTAMILKGEILRRLGRFDDAKAHLDSLKTSEPFKAKTLASIINLELELCGNKDSEPHDMPK